jgi:hypothetical protein
MAEKRKRDIEKEKIIIKEKIQNFENFFIYKYYKYNL